MAGSAESAGPFRSYLSAKIVKYLMAFGLGCVLASPLYAALKPGDRAPDFTTQATLAGKPFTFSLAESLKAGPVVLYFYPAAFTHGCTIEAHEFAEATDKFKALGATVIGVSHDPIDTLNKFSVSEVEINSRLPRTPIRKYPRPTMPCYSSPRIPAAPPM